MTKTKNQNTTNTQAKTTENGATVITAENVKTIGERIAIKALKTVYAKSGHEFILRLYNGLIADINDKTQKTLSDGYDVASVAQLYLLAYMGKSLQDTTNEKDKDGNPATVLRCCFRAVNRYIMGERQKVYKCVYVDDYNENGERLYYEIPQEWDIDGATDYKTITAIIKQLKLTDTEKKVLYYRLRGIAVDDTKKGKNGQPTQRTQTSTTTIAKKIGISQQAISKHLLNIRRKAVEIGLTPKTKTE